MPKVISSASVKTEAGWASSQSTNDQASAVDDGCLNILGFVTSLRKDEAMAGQNTKLSRLSSDSVNDLRLDAWNGLSDRNAYTHRFTSHSVTGTPPGRLEPPPSPPIVHQGKAPLSTLKRGANPVAAPSPGGLKGPALSGMSALSPLQAHAASPGARSDREDSTWFSYRYITIDTDVSQHETAWMDLVGGWQAYGGHGGGADTLVFDG